MAKKGGGGKGLFPTIVGGVISLGLIGIILAVIQSSGVKSVEEGINLAKEKSLKYSECIPSGECGLIAIIKDINLSGDKGFDFSINAPTSERPKDKIELPEKDGLKFDLGSLLLNRNVEGYKGPERGEAFVTAAGLVNINDSKKMLETLRTVPDKEEDVGYSRKEWKHWISFQDRSCWNTREEVLNRDSIPGSVKYIDKEKKSTKDYKKACAIGKPVEDSGKIKIETKDSGKWIDPYSGKKITDASELDIDHIIPLSNAARNGGQKWSAKEKEAFANDLDNLLATSAKENRSKGDKGPGKYMPPSKEYQCQYAKSYVTLAYKYNLSITKSDYKALDKAISSCKK